MRNSIGNVIATSVLVLALAVFLFSVPSYAESEPEPTARDAALANTQDKMRSFVLRAKREIGNATSEGGIGISALYRQMRSEEGDLRHDPVYLIVLRRAGNVVNHGKYTKSLYGDSLSELPTVEKLLDDLEGKGADADPVCTRYDHLEESTERWSCAVLFEPPVGNELRVLIGGFDHDPADKRIVRLECSDDFKPKVTADDVIASQYVSEERGRETLRDFVKGVIDRVRNIQAQGSQAQGETPLQRTINSVACLGKEPWNSGPIYLFIMNRSPNGVPVVIINGNNPELTGFPFVNVLDEDGIDVGEKILEVAGEHGQGGFVEYKWDNPLIKEDDVVGSNMSPGRSPKTSYVEAVRFSPTSGTLIFGSGIYGTLEGESESGGSDDDGGCAIAGTDGSRSAGAAFNLFLILFSLCCVSAWKGMRKKQRKFPRGVFPR